MAAKQIPFLFIALLMSLHSAQAFEKLKICILVEPSPITYTCGYSNRFKSLISYLSDPKIDEINVLTTEVVAKQLPKQWRGVPIHYIPGIRLPHYPLMSITFDYTLKVLRTVMKLKPDIIHVSSPGFLVFHGVVCSRLFQTPLVISYHTHLPVYVQTYLPPLLSGVAQWLIWKLIRLVHSFADLNLVTSPQILEEFKQHNVPRCDVWQKGIDSDRFHPRYFSESMRHRMTDGHPTDFLIAYIGRLGSEKRLKELKSILEKLPDNVRLCLVGGGPQEEELKKFFAGTRTIFAGMLHGDDLSSAFASVDCFCMPSDSETLGFVVLESMASSVPVVGAAAGGVKDLIDDGKTGFLVSPGDTEKFVACIMKLYRNPSLRRDFGRRGRIEAERWSWNSSMEKLRCHQYEMAKNSFSERIERRLLRLLNPTTKSDK